MEQGQENRTVYRFGEFTFDGLTGELERGGSKESLRPQVAATLVMLLERPGELVTREELRDELWRDGRIVSFDTAISTMVRQLRRALRDDAREPQYIETIPKRGYRLCCAVEPRPRGAGRRMEPGQGRSMRRRVNHTAGLVLITFTTLLLGGTASPPVSRIPGDHAPLVAVLPFTNLTGEAAQDIHAHAVTDAVIGYLSRVAPSRLRVTGLASVLRYAGRDVDPSRIGAELGADYLLEGSIRQRDAAVMASVRLLSAADATVAWSRDYRRAAETPELAGRSIAALTAGALAGVTLSRAGPGTAVQDRVPAAVARVREAVFIRDRFARTRGAEAVARLREAIELDPEYAGAHAALAETLLTTMGPDRTPDRTEEARAAANRALELDPLSAAAHRVLGNIHLYFDHDWDAAYEHLVRAVDLAPGSPQAHQALALWYSARGRHAEAVSEIELARVLDPRSIAVSADVMFVHLYARDFHGTLEAAERLSRLLPESDWYRRWMVIAKLGLGDLPGAAALVRAGGEVSARREGGDAAPVPFDDRDAVRAYFLTLGEWLERYPGEDPAAIAQWFALAGRTEHAAALVQEGLEARQFSYFVPFLGVSPAFDSLRGTASFEAGLRSLGQSGLAPAGDGLAVVAVPP